MNSNSTPFKKRNNPFSNSGTSSILDEQPKIVEEEPVKQVKEPVVQKSAPQKKIVDDANREKYTATMEKSLRKRVKIAAATAGIQVSTFIEEACLEKLEKEGL